MTLNNSSSISSQFLFLFRLRLRIPRPKGNSRNQNFRIAKKINYSSTVAGSFCLSDCRPLTLTAQKSECCYVCSQPPSLFRQSYMSSVLCNASTTTQNLDWLLFSLLTRFGRHTYSHSMLYFWFYSVRMTIRIKELIQLRNSF